MIPGVDDPDDRNLARLIDTQVARPLQQLPDTVVAHTPDAVLALAAATAVGASGADTRAWADAAGTGVGSGRGDH